MENQLKKTEKTLLTYLAQGITKEGKVDTKDVDRVGMNIELRKYKEGNGAPKYGELIKIPNGQRIPEMAKVDMRGTVTSVAVALTLAFEAMNLKNGMNAVQIVDLAEAIVDDAECDKIAIEDLLLFSQRLVRGNYGNLYESMDSIKFMGFFNQYRDERWEAAIKIRDEKHEEYKKLGDQNIFDRENPTDASPFGQHMNHLRLKTQARKDELYETKKSRRS